MEEKQENLIAGFEDNNTPSHEGASVKVVQELIQEKKISELREYVENHEAVDFVDVIDELSETDIFYLFKTVSSVYTAEIFSYLDNMTQQKIVNYLTSEDVLSLLKELSTDDLIDFVEELPANLTKKVLQAAEKSDKSKKELINQFLRFEEDSAGTLMTTEFVEIKEGSSVFEALKKIREVGREAETIATTFVIDSSKHLVGTLDLDDLIFADPEQDISAITKKDYISVFTDLDQEQVAELFKKYDLSVMPVVNHEARLLGIITVDDIIDVIEEETTEDIQKMAGTTPIDTPYMKTSVFKIAKSRIIWLLVLMVSATLTGLIINSFEEVLMAIPVLSVFIPMLMDTGGNAGNQTTTTITRALALGECKLHDYPRVLLKEFLVSLITGLIIAIVNFLWIFIELKTGIISNSSSQQDWLIAIEVSLTLFAIIIMAKCLGSSLPMLAKLVHLDPALMAGPLITTVLDTAALLVYFLFAKMILGL